MRTVRHILGAVFGVGFAAVVALALVIASGTQAADEVSAEGDKLTALRGTPDGSETREWPMYRGSSSLVGRVEAIEPIAVVKRVWQIKTEGAIEGGAAIVGGIIYLGTDEGILYALRLDDGSKVWQQKFEGSFSATPLVLKGMVYIGDSVGVFRALSAGDGKEIWKYDIGVEIHSSANTDGDRILFGAYDDHLHCLDPKSGDLIWKFPTQGPVHSAPAISDGKTFISGCDETFRVVDIATGREDAAVGMGGYTTASPAATGGHAYVGTFGSEVLAIDWKKGTKIWAYANAERSLPYAGTCAIDDARVIAAGRDKLVHCIDRESGKRVWNFRGRARFDSSPVIVGDRVFIGCSDGNLYAIDLKSGKKVWSFTTGAPIVASPSIAKGRLVVGDGDGNVHCFQIAKDTLIPSAVAAKNKKGPGSER